MKKNKIWLAVLSISVILSSCALAPGSMGGADDFAVEQEMEMAAMPAEAPRTEMKEVFSDEGSSGSSFDSASAVNVERIVIKNADLSIVVVDPSDAMDTISELAVDMGGFIVYSNLYKTTTSQGLEVPNANITIRVPAEKLETALAEIKGLVEDAETDILNENISGQDVTGEVTDLESRLRNLEAAEEQLREIMDNAVETEDVISVFHELTSVRGQIEVIQGQVKYYRESARLSAISVYLQAKAALEPITIGGWQPGVEAQRALQALVNGGQIIVNALIWLVLFALPILALIFVPIFLIIRFFKKRKGKKPSESKPKEKKA